MATDLTVYLDDRPGQVAAAAAALAQAGMNIDGGFALVVGQQGIMHLLVDDAATATRALEDADFEVRSPVEVLVLDVEDRPGSLAEISGRLAEAGVNLTVFYLATGTRLVIGSEDLDEIRSVLSP